MTLSCVKKIRLIKPLNTIKYNQGINLFSLCWVQSVVLAFASLITSTPMHLYAQTQDTDSDLKMPNTLVQPGSLIPWFSAWDLNETPKNRESVLNLHSSGHFFILLDRERLDNPVFIKKVGALSLFLKQLKIHLVVYVLGDFTNEMIRSKMNQFGLRDTDVLIDRYENFIPYVVDKSPKKKRLKKVADPIWLNQAKIKTKGDQKDEENQKEFRVIPELIILDSKGVITQIPKVGISLSEELIQDWFR